MRGVKLFRVKPPILGLIWASGTMFDLVSEKDRYVYVLSSGISLRHNKSGIIKGRHDLAPHAVKDGGGAEQTKPDHCKRL